MRKRTIGAHKKIILLGLLLAAIVGGGLYLRHREIAEAERVAREEAAKNAEAKVTIPEGRTVAQIAATLKAENMAEADAFLALVQKPATWPASWRTKYWFADPAKNPTKKLEGFLFPDTYRFYRDASSQKIAETMMDNFLKRTKGLLPADTKAAYKLVTEASILEKEVQTAEDMAIVADMINRRVAAGWRLEMDSTFHYAFPSGGKEAMTAKQLEKDSPYNTYKYYGLPPTPIGNPGLKALRAAARPTKNPYWFFLTGADDKVHYAKTLEEQVENKRKYL